MKFIDAKLAVAIHDLLIAEHGGARGTRDIGLLESALHRPVNIAAYEKEGLADIPRLAAAYAYGIAKNDPFVDGNKRTAAAVCEAFLDLNGYELMADDISAMSAILALADGSLSEGNFATWIKDNIELKKPAPKSSPTGRKTEP
jgi:death on curing protein